MAAVDPEGGQAYFFEGLPFEGVRNGSNDVGSQTFWFEGLADEWIIPASDAGQAAGHGGFALMGIGS